VLITKAGSLYQQGEYGEALPLLEQLKTTQKGDDRTTLALGVCYLEKGEYEKTISVLESAVLKKRFLYKDQAQWYTALSYLQLDKVEESKSILLTVAKNPNAFFKEKAEQLLTHLK